MSKGNEDNILSQNEDMLEINADEVLVEFFLDQPQHVEHEWITVEDIINLEDGEILSDSEVIAEFNLDDLPLLPDNEIDKISSDLTVSDIHQFSNSVEVKK